MNGWLPSRVCCAALTLGGVEEGHGDGGAPGLLVGRARCGGGEGHVCGRGLSGECDGGGHDVPAKAVLVCYVVAEWLVVWAEAPDEHGRLEACDACLLDEL